MWKDQGILLCGKKQAPDQHRKNNTICVKSQLKQNSVFL